MPNVTLRLPTDLHQALKHAAEREHRSLHAHILTRLEDEPVAVPARDAPAAALTVCDQARNHRRGAYCKSCGQVF